MSTPAARVRLSPENLIGVLNRFGLLVVILLGTLVMSQVSPAFFTWVNLTNVLFAASFVAVAAVGVMFVLLTGNIDLSVGALVGLSSVLVVGLFQGFGLPAWVAMLGAMLVGALFGFLNGVITTKLKISSLIVTLGTLSIARGLAFIYTGGANLTPLPPLLQTMGTARIGTLPVVIVFALLVAVIAHVVLTRTRFGRSVYAVGGNPVAARLSGIRRDRVIILAFMISGMLAAVGGMMLTVRLGAGSASSGAGLELTVIAAVVIGGTSLFGGEGRVSGTLLGVLLLGLVQNSINLLAVPPNFDLVVSGIVIVLAAGLDVYRRLYLEPALARRSAARHEPEQNTDAGRGEGSRPPPDEEVSAVSERPSSRS